MLAPGDVTQLHVSEMQIILEGEDTERGPQIDSQTLRNSSKGNGSQTSSH